MILKKDKAIVSSEGVKKKLSEKHRFSLLKEILFVNSFDPGQKEQPERQIQGQEINGSHSSASDERRL